MPQSQPLKPSFLKGINNLSVNGQIINANRMVSIPDIQLGNYEKAATHNKNMGMPVSQ